MNTEIIVPDLTLLIENQLTKKIESKEISPKTIIIPEGFVNFLEKLANENNTFGKLGIEELDKLKQLEPEHDFKLVFLGNKLRASVLKDATIEDIDSLAREIAYNEDGTLVTSNETQSKLSNAYGIPSIYNEINYDNRKLKLESFFNAETMSVHLRENVAPVAKRGRPGAWEFVEVKKKKMTQKEIESIAIEIIETAKVAKEGFIEKERFGSTIVQLGKFRIVITKPPFSDGWEITAVRPVKQMSLEEYELNEKILDRLSGKAEGILIAGSPGMGKTTFAAALANFYAEKDKIVKTVEAPRDLDLPDKITQYAISHGDSQEIHDILLLSRPDYTFFDEIRNTEDFKVFADLRLSGIGFIGVVHATAPIDAVQRFVGRIELGVIPQVIDTVIFIKNGTINKILSLNMVVKVPSGMAEKDLARPIIVVNDFETKKPEFEIYTYGEETVVIPVNGYSEENAAQRLAKKQLERELTKFDVDKIEMLSNNRCRIYTAEENMANIIGKQGKNISDLEKKLGIGIDVQSSDTLITKSKDGNDKGEEVFFQYQMTSKSITLKVNSDFINESCDIYVNDAYLLTAKVSKKGQIKIKKNNKIGQIIMDGLNMGDDVRVYLAKKA